MDDYYEVPATGLLEISAESPVLFLLEDAHWVDPSTHGLLGQIASHVVSAPVMVVIIGTLKRTAENIFEAAILSGLLAEM